MKTERRKQANDSILNAFCRLCQGMIFRDLGVRQRVETTSDAMKKSLFAETAQVLPGNSDSVEFSRSEDTVLRNKFKNTLCF